MQDSYISKSSKGKSFGHKDGEISQDIIKKTFVKIKKDENPEHVIPEVETPTFDQKEAKSSNLFDGSFTADALKKEKPEEKKAVNNVGSLFGNFGDIKKSDSAPMNKVSDNSNGSLFKINPTPLEKPEEKKIVEVKKTEEEKPKASSSLFGNADTTSGSGLFGNNSSTAPKLDSSATSLFSKPDNAKDPNAGESKSKQPTQGTSLFKASTENLEAKTVKPSAGSLFANATDKSGPTSIFSNPSKPETKSGGLFGNISENKAEDKKKDEAVIGTDAFAQFQRPAENNMDEDNIETEQKQGPLNTQQTANTQIISSGGLFGNDSINKTSLFDLPATAQEKNTSNPFMNYNSSDKKNSSLKDIVSGQSSGPGMFGPTSGAAVGGLFNQGSAQVNLLF